MPMIYPAYCRHCDRITGHRRKFGMKTECQRCHDIKPVPIARWLAGTLFFMFAFGIAAYMLYASLSVLWPLFAMPFIDYETAEVTFGLLLIPGFVAYAWVTGKVIR
jgi:membrane protein YdbS with pleckstrin-like domain